ncbi:hypothetical protein LCGC14_3151560, partial [marine sediment metagenome]
MGDLPLRGGPDKEHYVNSQRGGGLLDWRRRGGVKNGR